MAEASGQRRRILFVTRTYPPTIGGMEQYCRDLYENLSAVEDVALLANGGGKAQLPVFLLRAVVHLFRNAHRFTHIHFGDASLSPLIPLARRFSSARMSVTTYGLDVVFAPRLYQWLVPRCLRGADAVVCISGATEQECRARGVTRTRVIPCGIDANSVPAAPFGLERLEEQRGLPAGSLGGAGRLLLSLSRLVPRKGQEWFVREVMPLLPKEVRLVIAGEGPEREAIARAVAEGGLAGRVVLLDRVSEDEKNCLYGHADLFVMPNRRVAGDMEGFGITVIEATARGLPVIGARVDGIVDAILEGETGHLIAEGDAAAFARCVQECSLQREAVARRTRENYAWSAIVERYVEVFE